MSAHKPGNVDVFEWDLVGRKMLTVVFKTEKFKSHYKKIFSDLEGLVRYEISAEFYPILMYDMSKSDKNDRVAKI